MSAIEKENLVSTINLDLIDMSSENVLGAINDVIANIPANATILEKIRWVYIRLGQIFSYDYRKGLTEYQSVVNPIDMEKYVGKYQSCLEMTEVLNYILNRIAGVKSRTITRKNSELRGHAAQDHVANEVTFEQDGYEFKIMLDLALDLSLIQSRSKTMHFGFEDDGSGTYTVIPQVENRTMDVKLGLIGENQEYTDEIIKRAESERFNSTNPEETINRGIQLINSLSMSFSGYHEGKQFMGLLFHRLLPCYYKEFNLYYRGEGKINLKTFYKLELNGCEKWVMYSKEQGLLEVDPMFIAEMLNSGWTTNSRTLMENIYGDKSNIK